MSATISIATPETILAWAEEEIRKSDFGYIGARGYGYNELPIGRFFKEDCEVGEFVFIEEDDDGGMTVYLGKDGVDRVSRKMTDFECRLARSLRKRTDENQTYGKVFFIGDLRVCVEEVS